MITSAICIVVTWVLISLAMVVDAHAQFVDALERAKLRRETLRQLGDSAQ